MTEDRMPLAELLQKSGDGDFLKSVAERPEFRDFLLGHGFALR